MNGNWASIFPNTKLLSWREYPGLNIREIFQKLILNDVSFYNSSWRDTFVYYLHLLHWFYKHSKLYLVGVSLFFYRSHILLNLRMTRGKQHEFVKFFLHVWDFFFSTQTRMCPILEHYSQNGSAILIFGLKFLS